MRSVERWCGWIGHAVVVGMEAVICHDGHAALVEELGGSEHDVRQSKHRSQLKQILTKQECW